ncbi:MAG: hypothetical protein WA840_17515 [Caulobacteraceae bacterium]
MKRLMATAMAATLMCGATAFAQDMQPGAQPAAQPAAAPADAGNVVSNAPAGQPPAEYPPCTHRGEDRCVARAGLSEGHAKAHHHKAKAKAAEPAAASTGA